MAATKKQSLSDLLNSLGVTTGDLAALTGYSHFAISFWRRGSSVALTDSVVTSLSNALHVDRKKIVAAYDETRRRRVERDASGLDARTVDARRTT